MAAEIYRFRFPRGVPAAFVAVIIGSWVLAGGRMSAGNPAQPCYMLVVLRGRVEGGRKQLDPRFGPAGLVIPIGSSHDRSIGNLPPFLITGSDFMSEPSRDRASFPKGGQRQRILALRPA